MQDIISKTNCNIKNFFKLCVVCTFELRIFCKIKTEHHTAYGVCTPYYRDAPGFIINYHN